MEGEGSCEEEEDDDAGAGGRELDTESRYQNLGIDNNPALTDAPNST